MLKEKVKAWTQNGFLWVRVGDDELISALGENYGEAPRFHTTTPQAASATLDVIKILIRWRISHRSYI